ncbi:MAG TPA: mechanosensitive ion channel domain-containing protein [Steroidobacteraceae bacterium]|nr:mechanosensitive ion channel domain-containing protein [Steroidobacteraceae bacterium]
MSRKQRLFAGLLILLLLAAGFAWWRTAPPTAKVSRQRAADVAAAQVVDQSTYTTAERLSHLADTPDEQNYAQAALRVADHALAFAFTTALRDVEAHPPELTPEARAIQERVRKSQALFDADQQRVTQLTAELAQAKDPQQSALQDDLDLAQSQLDLDKDELDEANQDLLDAGGNVQQRIEALQQEHEAEIKARTPVTAALAKAPAEEHGSWSRWVDWLHLRQKRQDIDDAASRSSQKSDRLAKRRAGLADALEKAKSGIAELSQHTRGAKEPGAAPAGGLAATPGPAPTPAASPRSKPKRVPKPATAAPAAASAAAGPAPATATPAVRSHTDAAALLSQTKLIEADQKVITLLDRRISDQRQLATIYGQWSASVGAREDVVAHTLLLNALIVIGVLLAMLLIDGWLERLLNRPKLDRRQIETLRSLTRVALRVTAVVIILLIVIGMPTQFGAMIGIIGAGLTVALKDFIVAFFGWLILMGKNGIRLGDWVEINGVSGEVTELGMFHTVLLETGNWSDSGRPTGRRVTFTNSFAIEKHYFNFSTSGQWLWDELQVVVPSGRDPYPIVDAITKKVAEATADSARQAEQEWQRSVPTDRGKTFSGTPGINVKPVVGGVEIAIRYITRAHERFMLRAKLYEAAVQLLGENGAV